MASPTTKSITGSMTVGEQIEALKRLQALGVSGDSFASIGVYENIEFASEVADAFLRRQLFDSPQKQIQSLLALNQIVWKDSSITKTAIAALGDPPDCPPWDKRHIWCVCLFYETGDAVKTLELNWKACVNVHTAHNTDKYSGLAFTPDIVRQRENANQRPVGLRWQCCELGRQFCGQKVSEVRPQLDKLKTTGMGQELPLIAALHPEWAKSMNGRNIPFVQAPDLELTGCYGQSLKFVHVPYLHFDRFCRVVIDTDSHPLRVEAGSCGVGTLQ